MKNNKFRKILHLYKYCTRFFKQDPCGSINIICMKWLFYYLFNTRNKLSTILHFHIIDSSDLKL